MDDDATTHSPADQPVQATPESNHDDASMTAHRVIRIVPWNGKTLADTLTPEQIGDVPPPPPAEEQSLEEELLGVDDPREFCRRILTSREFRRYILNGIVSRDIPAAVLCRVIDHAWGKPPERVEHTGKDGDPIAIAEVRRVIIHVNQSPDKPVIDVEDDDYTKH